MPSSIASRCPARTASLAMRTVSGLLLAIFAASSRVRARSSSCATTISTRPSSLASAAPIMSPVSTRRIAWPRPARRDSRWVPPPPGISPRLISGWPKRAFSEATRKSQDMASSQPPPRQKPLIIAITGFGKAAMMSKMRGLRMAWR